MPLPTMATAADAPLARAEPGMRPLGKLAATRIYASDIRGVWRVRGLDVWFQSGPTSADLPEVRSLLPLVRNSRAIAPSRAASI